MTRAPGRTRAASGTTVRAVQATAVLSALVLLWQFATAGRLISGTNVLSAHAGGAIALHIATGLLVAATALHWRRSGGPVWAVALAAAVFLCTFVQAYLGSHGDLAVHVPGALLLTVGTVWLLSWSFNGGTRA
jgi:uncharacterized membrane protein YozB (DUF420 family)